MPKKKKDILIITYDFPPYVGGGGVNRILKLVKYLNYSKYKVHVIAAKTIRNYFSGKDRVNELRNTLADVKYLQDPIPKIFLPHKLKVLSLNLPKKIWGLSKFKSFIFPDITVIWTFFLILNIHKILKSNSYHKLIISTPPHSLNLICLYFYYISKKESIVLDIRDMWVGNDIFVNNSLHNKAANWVMQKAIHRSNYITATTKAMVDTIKREYKCSKITEITNGYDPDDLLVDKKYKIKKKILILYAGAYDEIGGRRDLKYLIDAISIANGKELQFEIYGPIKNSVVEYTESLQNVTVYPSMKYHGIQQYIQINSNIMVVVITPDEDAKHAVPGKYFEYLQFKIPILVLCPKDAAIKWYLEKTKSGIAVEYDNVHEIARGLEYILENYDLFSFVNIEKYSRIVIAKMFEHVIDG